jgi:hypothetical protein
MKPIVVTLLFALLFSFSFAQYGTLYLTGHLASYNETEQVECSDGVLQNLQDDDVDGVTCYFTTLSMDRTKEAITNDANTFCCSNGLTSWSGWQQTDSGWRADAENEDGSGAELYLSRQGNGVYFIAYALEY